MLPIIRTIITLVVTQGLFSNDTHGASVPKISPRTALVIGNARYEAAVGPLRNSGNDAKAVAKALRELGFSVIEKHDITRDQLFKAVLDFRGTLPGAEVGLFYFAGHGLSVAGSNYLVSLKSGYTPEGADDVTLRMLAETKLFNVEQAVADMASAGARCNIVILDACRTTALARTGRTRDVANPGGLSEIKPPAGSLIAFATDAGQTAQDGTGTNGLYTEELLKHLRTPGLSIEQVFKRTRAGVLERSEGGQIPAEYSRLVGDDIFLAGPLSAALAIVSVGSRSPDEPLGNLSARHSAEVKSLPVVAPSLKEILAHASSGKAEECTEALRTMVKNNGFGSYAVAPLEVLLERVKDDLKDPKASTSKRAAAVQTCTVVLDNLEECLSPENEKRPQLKAKALNRRGDALLVLGQAEEALHDFEAAIPLLPEDSYILYNRGQAFLALGRKEEARADFTSAASTKWKQPGALKLATKALAELK
ncbi:MAG: caspase family protein [Verrucomicrobiota bacterium]